MGIGLELDADMQMSLIYFAYSSCSHVHTYFSTFYSDVVPVAIMRGKNRVPVAISICNNTDHLSMSICSDTGPVAIHIHLE